jgi:prephenate dehydrogenase
VTSEAHGIAAVRGAVPVRANTASDIVDATARLLKALLEINRLEPARIVSALFTTTEDLDADFPAHAARRLGWSDVPMLHAREIPVPGAMPRVVRVMLTVWGVTPGKRLTPVYLDEAAALRPDLVVKGATEPTSGAGQTKPARSVALIGLGQIGGSIGLSLPPARWHRVGWDVDPTALAAARSAWAIDHAAASLAEACAGADLAVIATPVDALSAAIDAAAAALAPGAALLDTGSARRTITPALERAATRGIRAVGGHPLAGNEGRGFAAARAGAMQGARFALLPLSDVVPAIVHELLTDLGAQPLTIDPAAHDRALARTSHMPYLLACALRELGTPFAERGLSGPGFRDMTRLAGGDPGMAGAFCRANAHEVAEAWRELVARMNEQVAALG